MAANIFFGEIGDEPLGYVGYRVLPQLVVTNPINNQYVDLVDVLFGMDVINPIHSQFITEITPITPIINSDTIHLVDVPVIRAAVRLGIKTAIHKNYYYDKLNAPVNFKCGNYLNTPSESRFLETPLKDC